MHLKQEYKRVHPSPAWPTLTLMEGKGPARILSLSNGRAVRTGLVQGQMDLRSFFDQSSRLRVKLRGTKSTDLVKFTGGPELTLRAGKQKTVIFKVSANEKLTTLTVKSPSGVPDAVFVDELSVRLPDGRWQSLL
jgi:hypothetical protein